jgi:hypothetical protein
MRCLGEDLLCDSSSDYPTPLAEVGGSITPEQQRFPAEILASYSCFRRDGRTTRVPVVILILAIRLLDRLLSC